MILIMKIDQQIKMKKIKCHHCDYIWTYKGKSDYYCPCPRCSYKVNIKKCEVKEDENRN